jgi:copper oxidase (laccase) domain-containing protein
MNLVIHTSSYDDGSMKPLTPDDIDTCTIRRYDFLEAHEIAPENATNVRLEYVGDDYCRYATLTAQDKGNGIIQPSSFITDAMVVTEPGHALFLPLADCIGAVIHDPDKGILMLSHLGRHNLEQFGGTKSVEYLVREHEVNPHDLTVWLSPAAGKEHYPLFSFDNRSLHDVATEQFLAAGVSRDHIDISSIDSARDDNYYSHSQFLKGNRPDDGRFAVAAMMTR